MTSVLDPCPDFCIIFPKQCFPSYSQLSEEYSYILDRSYAFRRPGNMLSRPSLLLSPWDARDTETDTQQHRHATKRHVRSTRGDPFGGEKGRAEACQRSQSEANLLFGRRYRSNPPPAVRQKLIIAPTRLACCGQQSRMYALVAVVVATTENARSAQANINTIQCSVCCRVCP